MQRKVFLLKEAPQNFHFLLFRDFYTYLLVVISTFVLSRSKDEMAGCRKCLIANLCARSPFVALMASDVLKIVMRCVSFRYAICLLDFSSVFRRSPTLTRMYMLFDVMELLADHQRFPGPVTALNILRMTCSRLYRDLSAEEKVLREVTRLRSK